MKKYVLTMLAGALVLVSCTKEMSNASDLVNSKISHEKSAWKTTAISEALIAQQQKVSHYEFDAMALRAMLEDPDIAMVWFDLGLNNAQQLTFTATGENADGTRIAELTSSIVLTAMYPSHFARVMELADRTSDYQPESPHELKNSDALSYLNAMANAYENFEAVINQDGQRVERFGMDSERVKQMLLPEELHKLTLFLGLNKQGKMTTVFIGKHQEGHLLINSDMDRASSRKAYDFTKPCPPTC